MATRQDHPPPPQPRQPPEDTTLVVGAEAVGPLVAHSLPHALGPHSPRPPRPAERRLDGAQAEGDSPGRAARAVAEGRLDERHHPRRAATAASGACRGYSVVSGEPGLGLSAGRALARKQAGGPLERILVQHGITLAVGGALEDA